MATKGRDGGGLGDGVLGGELGGGGDGYTEYVLSVAWSDELSTSHVGNQKIRGGGPAGGDGLAGGRFLGGGGGGGGGGFRVGGSG